MSLKSVDVHGFGQIKFFVRDGEGIHDTDEIVIRETFVENIYTLHPSQFEWTGIFLDIGANIGAVSLLAMCLGARSIIAYEPEPYNYQAMLRNIRLNSAPNIECHHKAVWSSECNIPLVPLQGSSTSHPDALEAFDGNIIYVPAITLAQVLKPYDEIDLLKCDTEGAEYEIFQSRETNQKVRRLVMEYHTTTADKFGALLALLSLTHNIQVFGHYDTGGGQIVGIRYED